MLAPWHESDLKLKCEHCHLESEDVSTNLPHDHDPDEYVDLCEKCYGKRATESSEKSDDANLQ